MHDVTYDWIGTDIYSMETQENANNCNKYIHPDSDLHIRPSFESKALLEGMYQSTSQALVSLKILNTMPTLIKMSNL